MAGVRIVTDSTSDLPAEWRAEYGIVTVTLPINIGTESFRDNLDLTPAQFFARQEAGPPYPTTANPAVGQVAETFRRLRAEGAESICALCFSSSLGGTYAAVALGAAAVADEITVEVIDTRAASIGVGFLAVEAAKCAATGASLAEVTMRVRRLMPEIATVFVVDSLKWLKRGGRINKARALLGSVLTIKPLLVLRDGALEPLQQPRTRTRALDALAQWVQSFPHPAALAVLYDGTPEALPEADAFAARLGTTATHQPPVVTRYGTVYAVHLGPRVLGAVVLKHRQ